MSLKFIKFLMWANMYFVVEGMLRILFIGREPEFYFQVLLNLWAFELMCKMIIDRRNGTTKK